MSSITVYTKPACVQCNATYKALDKQGLSYEVVDISQDPEARDYVMALGYLQAPGRRRRRRALVGLPSRPHQSARHCCCLISAVCCHRRPGGCGCDPKGG